MTSMQEKKPSAKAKTYNRFNGKQDHGDAHSRKGHEKISYWEKRWEERGEDNTDKTYLKEVIRDGLAAHETEQDDLDIDGLFNDPNETKLFKQQVEDEYESLLGMEEFESNQAFLDYESEDEKSHAEYLKFLQEKFKELSGRLQTLPQLTDNEPEAESLNQERLQVESELLEVVAEIKELLNQPDYPEATYGVTSKRELRNRMARAATLDDYSDDDLGDTEQESHIRIHKIR